MRRPHKPWPREQIRAARKTPITDVLEGRGLTLQHTGAGNFTLAEYPGIFVKDCYWRNPEKDLSGNTIDFLINVVGLSFAQAMEEIVRAQNLQ